MATPLPNDEVLSKIDAALTDAGAIGPNARALAIRAYANAEFDEDQITSWIAIQPPKFFGITAAKSVTDDAAAAANGTPKPSNPFSKAGWNITEQGRLVNANKDMAASLASACGVAIGATKPNL